MGQQLDRVTGLAVQMWPRWVLVGSGCVSRAAPGGPQNPKPRAPHPPWEGCAAAAHARGQGFRGFLGCLDI